MAQPPHQAIQSFDCRFIAIQGTSSMCAACVHLLFFSLHPQSESMQVRPSVSFVKENIADGLSQHARGDTGGLPRV